MNYKEKIAGIFLATILIVFFGFFIYPQVNAVTINKKVGETAVVTANCTDPDSNLASCQVTSPCSNTCSASGAAGSCSCNFTCTNLGSFSICGRAIDALGLQTDGCGSTVVCNSSPLVDAGPDKEIFEGQQTILEGSGSDPDGYPVTFSWSCANGSLSSAGVAQPTYTSVAVSSDTNYVCTLSVTDNQGVTVSDSMTVTVKNTTLSVALSVNPECSVASPCRSPLRGVSLTADVLPASTAIGSTANYTFWCHCSYSGTNINTAVAQCGTWNHKADGADPTSYVAQGVCNYTSSIGGTYSPKVIVEKGLAAAAEARRVANFVVLPNNTPTVQDLRMNPSECTNDCKSCSEPLHPVLYWTFIDDSWDSQTAFEIHVATNSNFNNYINLTGGKRSGDTQIFTISNGNLSFDNEYWWRIRAWDGADVASAWAVYPGTYKTVARPYPEPAFSWSPIRPELSKEVQFSNESKCYNEDREVISCGDDPWSWTFQDTSPETSNKQNPVVFFSLKPGEKTVTLLVTDSFGLYCESSQKVNTTSAIPKWREIIPW